MTAPAKQSSRWGSFLSQAVAGVEARLDTILAENDDGPGDSKRKPPRRPRPLPSRAASTNRVNDRLQERLARAMAAKKSAAAGQKSESPAARNSLSTQASPRQSIDAPSRGSTESVERPLGLGIRDSPRESLSQRVSLDVPRKSQEVTRKSHDIATEEASLEQEPARDEKKGAQEAPTEVNGERISMDQPHPLTAPTESTITVEASVGDDVETDVQHGDGDQEEQVSELDRALQDAQLQHQEEIHGYVERIDALEAKLQYLARDATESARKAALAAPAGSAEKKLAEKDQQIALLMEEGKNLASTEQKHRAIMKKLRAKVAEVEKDSTNLRTAKEKSEKEAETLRRRVRQAEELEKSHDDLHRRLEQSYREVNALRPELRSKDAAIAELKAQLQKATQQAEATAAKVNDQAREQDRRKIAELEDAVAALQVEKALVADRAKKQASELKEKAERATERSRALELELKAEVQVMESKLEGMRVRAEEASSGAMGDSQAKLLRQVETLQTQYAIASENWQGIEATLLARINSLERERDEALQRESDMRRKAREAVRTLIYLPYAVRAKRHEEELEDAKTTLPHMQEDVKTYRAQLDALQKRADEAEAALASARVDFEKQKQAWEAEKEDAKQQQQQQQQREQSRQPADRRSWLEDLPGGPFLKIESRPASPQLSAPQRTFSNDFLGIQSLSVQSLTSKVRKASAPSSNSGTVAAGGDDIRGFSRRPSVQPLVRPSPSTHSSSFFSPSASTFSPTGGEPPAAHPLDRDQQPPHLLHRSDTFDSVETSSSPRQVLQDMVSVSTVAAGPSVQLVERMSAAIRRLESEKVAAREELARISRQRDEARAEIVALMREAEGSRKAMEQVARLEAEVAEVNARYDTTLEMLGEKSELVEELKADVEDVKGMYRDLVERTVK
ncbi:TATA element modulatory factor 1 TATA binding-domain-containing protein [Bombardia bombarda]|uniref:TATA element modulatory factor 1 TATA binding-domain-containing protein n=1 Tax=Bombardia bombarda TaxID=252184 RepID=A0AA39X734_9PEZI|nr:TATA element modulatory factor 1 TATA binding-domain-containing protein [Bombardia bombarda]